MTVGRLILMGVGFFFVVLGIVGAFLPVIPSIPFFVIASVCFSKSSKKFHDLLMNNPLIGPHVRRYHENNGISWKLKAGFILLQWSSIVLSSVFLVHGLLGRVLMGLIGIGATAYILSLKTAHDKKPWITSAEEKDLPVILELQKLAFQSEASIYGCCAVPPLSQTFESIQEEFKIKTFLKLIVQNRIIGSVRCFDKDGVCRVEKLVVHPDFQNQGLGGRLLQAVEKTFPRSEKYELMTGAKSTKNIHLYQKNGYKIFREEVVPGGIAMVWMEKKISRLGV